MKLSHALVMASALLVSVAHATDPVAPPPPPPGMGAGMGMGMGMDNSGMHAELKLTAEQQAKLRPIFEDARVRHEAIRAEMHKKVGAVLTPDQMKVWEAHQARMAEMRADKQQERNERIEKRNERMEKRAEKMEKRAEQVRGKPENP